MQKQHRLSKNWQFQEIISGNKKIETKFIVGYYAPNTVARMRIGISVSKKFAGAVERNLQKRHTRAIIDLLEKEESFMGQNAIDLILILRKPFLEANFKRKQVAIAELISKLKGKE